MGMEGVFDEGNNESATTNPRRTITDWILHGTINPVGHLTLELLVIVGNLVVIRC